ncbi:VOC family protein [Chromobacterium sp. IIBBL 290-4]|uniref:VOC family protein n=1 Tax=Chromobacterium sp. IIBBL 290-4 TaxID=2953890 RepID=UPI0020B7CCC5|nr:VOC family protein [Chromobacterium sp. IIBBL 290-4]UTH73682.1 VOC family protein [Chromobacterium sp. IIBBL 290-4]
MTPAIARIDHIHLYVRDRRAAQNWYRRVLGLEAVPSLAFWNQDGGPLTLTDRDDILHLALFEQPEPMPSPVIALAASAADFWEWRKHLETQLAMPLKVVDHHISWSMYFADPDGNRFEISSYDYVEIAAAIPSRS